MIDRREWFRVAALYGGTALLGRRAAAQAPVAAIRDTSNLFPMDQGAARSVRRPAKPGATPSMQPVERDALEHRLRCQCGCTLDVFTCRTTDFSCRVSPAMHRDIMALVDGGYGAQEIIDSFVDVYGDQVLMAPPKEGFNIVGYVLPAASVAVGAVLLAVVLRRWRRPASSHSSREASVPVSNATPDELARLEAAVRDDS